MEYSEYSDDDSLHESEKDYTVDEILQEVNDGRNRLDNAIREIINITGALEDTIHKISLYTYQLKDFKDYEILEYFERDKLVKGVSERHLQRVVDEYEQACEKIQYCDYVSEHIMVDPETKETIKEEIESYESTLANFETKRDMMEVKALELFDCIHSFEDKFAQLK